MKKEELEEKVESIEKELNENKRKNRILKLIILLLILSLLVMCLVGYKLGKIGYSTINSSGSTNENIDLIEIADENGLNWKNNELQIFKNQEFGGEKKIAPNSKGTYKFYVKNQIEDNIKYNICLLDEMSHFVNMKYKLKINDVYICGNKDEYVGIDEMNVENVVLSKGSTTLYTLEWYWEDNDELDTYVGSLDGQYYTLKLNIQATSILSN